MPRYRIWQALVAVGLFVALLGQGTWALAGTTGGLSGTVVSADNGAAIANAKVTASSPSETVSTTTDATGHFIFISLAPDTYSVSVEKEGYQAVSTAGVSIFADATQVVSLRMPTALKTIAKVTSTAAGSLVKAGTTADVYSVNAATQSKISALGGGGSLNSAYAAVASVPGAFVPLNQTGYYQTVHIRGGDYDQVGYELDGVPVNRSFDNYPSGALSSLGMQELQVYTGAAPSNSEGQGLAGYINQVMKSGTYPGFASITGGIGAPTFYHKLAFEAGGATPNRLFSYYVGIGGYNQDIRYINNNNGNNYNDLGVPFNQLACPGDATNLNFASCYASGIGPGGYSMLPFQTGLAANITDRDVIANFHFGIPHKHDGGRDDVQLLFDSGLLHYQFYDSTNDQGGPAAFGGTAANCPNCPVFVDGFQYNGPVGVLLNTVPNASSLVQNYLFPDSNPQRSTFATIPYNQRDTQWNDQEIFKLQYQKNLGTSAYFRIYGYTYYSDWLMNGPQSTIANYFGPVPPDYELTSHTRGLSATFADQINPNNLLSLQGSYTTASAVRDNNTQMINFTGSRSRALVAVNANDPLSGICYGTTALGNFGPTTCDPAKNMADFETWGDLQGGTLATLPTTCGSGSCQYLIAENSQWATYNAVKPIFTAVSINDQWRPTDKLLLNLGLRYDGYEYQGSSTKPTDPARIFWFNAFNNDKCVQASTGRLFDKAADLSVPIATPCSAITGNGGGFTAPNLLNESAQVLKYTALQPRIAGTYTLNADSVIRFSFGKYAEPPNTAFEQYNSQQENLPGVLGAFVPYGFNTPGHVIRPATSYNTDLSFEHRFKNSDWSFKLTPFLRKTHDQIQQFFLDQRTGFVSGLNVGRQTSEGVEFQLNKGDFNRNGLSGSIAFTYTHSTIDYNTLSNGNTVVSAINHDIDSFNALTQAGGGAACYVATVNGSGGITGANPAACTAVGAYANPYFGAAMQGHVSATNLPTYDLLPGPVGASAASYGVPYFATIILNYKHDKLAITPTLQYQGGGRYGSPESNLGIDPTAGCFPLTGSNSANDPRYIYGGQSGTAGYDALSCPGTLAVPNTYTKRFDPMGAFVQPSQIIGNVQISYDVSPKVQLVGTFANIINRCFGGSKEAWTYNDPNICSYGLVGNGGLVNPVGNVYNPGATLQPELKYPYGAGFGGVNPDGNSTRTPFAFYLEANIKL